MARISWSSESCRIARSRSRSFHLQTDGFVVKSLDGRYPEKVALSPDGRFIAYDITARVDQSARDIFLLAADGSRETAVIQNPGNDRAPMWSPDGSRLVFLSDRTGHDSLWTQPMAGDRASGTAELVKADVGRISPLGLTRQGAVYYSLGSSGRNGYIAELGPDLSLRKAPALATDRYVNATGGGAWSRDGKYLAYYSYRGTRDSLGTTVLVIRTLKTGEERELPLRPHIVPFGFAAPVWFPDGRAVLVVSHEPQRLGRAYHRLDLATGTPDLLYSTTGEESPTGRESLSSNPEISPDGHVVFFAYSRSGRLVVRKLMRLDPDTRHATEVKRLASLATYVSWALSPDGTHVAYLLSHPSHATSLEVMPMDGGESRELFRAAPWNSAGNGMAWTPDQRHLLFVKREGARGTPEVLWHVPATGGVAEKTGMAGASILTPRLHPDGRRIAFESVADAAKEIWVLENFLPKATAAR